MSVLVRLHRRLNRPGSLSPADHLLLFLLVAPSWMFGWLARARVLGYRWHVLRSHRADVPVISVGNLAVGGTGKTPVVDLLIKRCLNRGLRVAVISRGYGGRSPQAVNVVCAGDGPVLTARECGDEPLLLARRNPAALVLTARRRWQGVDHAVKKMGAQIVILDDGFQHLAVERDLDLLLLDAASPFGNGLPLPAGVLREFPVACRRADLLLLTNSRGNDPLPPLAPRPHVRLSHRLAASAVSLAGDQVPLATLAGKKLYAFSGIAHPSRFFQALQASGLELAGQLELADHADYTAELKRRIDSGSCGADFLVTTEKDGVKLSSDDFSVTCLQIPLELEITEGRQVLDRCLAELFNKGAEMNLSQSLLEILACPQCKGQVTLETGGAFIVCAACAVRYPVRDGIPVMLIDEAVPLASGSEGQ